MSTRFQSLLRGRLAMSAISPTSDSGSSPRGRGTAKRPHNERWFSRFIPAWAGNSTARRSGERGQAVHPRVGGEQGSWQRHPRCPRGSSPRGRGTVIHGLCRGAVQRFIPAWAGNRPLRVWSRRKRTVHPRVGGEQISMNCRRPWPSGSSPRGRGTADLHKASNPYQRFIPAWAGNR